MAKSHDEWLTDEEVEVEIERLKGSEAVKLARKKMRFEYRRRQVLYGLRNLEKKGKELMAAGITSEMLDQMYADESLSSEEV
jgi:hypothetical protein